MLRIISIIIFAISIQCMKFTTTLQQSKLFCFYEVYQSNQKFSFDVAPTNSQTYRVQVKVKTAGQWREIYAKETTMPYQNINVHKIAQESGTYMFCVKTQGSNMVRLSINIQSGLELMEFELLPDANDSDNLDRQLDWIQKQKVNLMGTLSRLQGLRYGTAGLANLMSTKMIAFAILGMCSIIVVNILFYRQLKKTFKERKLI